MIHSFIRAFRKQHRLSQQDLADLIQVSRDAIESAEAGLAKPTLDLAFRLQVVFGVQPATLFPAMYGRIEERVMRRAKERHDALAGRTGKRAEALRELLDAMPRHILIEGAEPTRA